MKLLHMPINPSCLTVADNVLIIREDSISKLLNGFWTNLKSDYFPLTCHQAGREPGLRPDPELLLKIFIQCRQSILPNKTKIYTVCVIQQEWLSTLSMKRIVFIYTWKKSFNKFVFIKILSARPGADWRPRQSETLLRFWTLLKLPKNFSTLPEKFTNIISGSCRLICHIPLKLLILLEAYIQYSQEHQSVFLSFLWNTIKTGSMNIQYIHIYYTGWLLKAFWPARADTFFCSW